jgi:LmbE family N-acetylglucosaminyl deacetylase
MTEDQIKIAEQQSLSGINKLWNALIPLTHLGSFMNTGAHPDDERSHILTMLARKHGVRVSYATATRGKGGQNAIGTEAGPDLGAFRTEEMQAAAAQIPMAVHWFSDQFDDPITDFGFSTDPAEAEQHWGKDLLRERMVRIIRTERPDIISPTFLDVDGQHGHHRAITRATIDTYDLAADPAAFPDQLSKEGLSVWQVKKLYLSATSGRGGVYDDSVPPPDATISLNTGEWDHMAGATYRQIGEWSRSRHLTQGMGRWYDAKNEVSHLHRLKCAYDLPLQETDLFFGLIQNYDDMATMVDGELTQSLKQAEIFTRQAIAAFPIASDIVPHLLNLSTQLYDIDKKLIGQSVQVIHELAHRIKLKQKQVGIAIVEASGLKADILWDNDFVSPGETLTGKISLYNTSHQIWEGLTLSLYGADPSQLKKIDTSKLKIAPGKQTDVTVRLTVPTNTPYHHPLNMNYEPHWQKEKFSCVIGIPTKNGIAEKIIVPSNPVLVVPSVNLSWEATGLYYNRLTDGDPVQATLMVDKLTVLDTDLEVGLESPPNWQITPKTYKIKKGEFPTNTNFNFVISGPTGGERLTLKPYVKSNIARFEENVLMMNYPHIRNTCKIVKNTLTVQPVDLEIPTRLKVGYVNRGSDRVWFWLQRFGVQVTMLSVEDLKTTDLSAYDTIMVGIRAFSADLAAASPFLRSYVENGGNLVTQYNRTDDDWDNEKTPPRYIKIGTPSFRWRITDPNAKVIHLVPDHHLLNAPNKIDEEDWHNWYQERGLYFIDEADSSYQKLLSMADPGKEPLTGALISGKIGNGWHHHCCLILHHQLEHQVPGAARLLANLITPPDWK